MDVTDTTDNLALAMDGADVVVVATGFVPGNPFKMSAAAHEVDNCFDFEHSHERPSGWVSGFPGVQNYKRVWRGP